MALRIRYQNSGGLTLGYSIERLADGLFYDFADSTFKASPTTLVASLPADSGNFAGRYKATLTPTPQAQFADGDYCVTIHNTAAANAVVDQLTGSLLDGDDGTVGILSPGGLDAVVVETGVNARQALALIGAATAGKASGLDTATATFYAMGTAGTATARIVATTAAGNRTATILHPPA